MSISMAAKKAGIFRSNYVAYAINTESKGLSVERRYKDFDSLRQVLIKRYPGFVIPPIPKKKVGKRFDAEFLNKRKIQLQYFLNEVLVHPVLRTSEIVSMFLSLLAKEWETKVKTAIKAQPPKEFTEFITFDGIANVELTKGAKDYCNTLSKLSEPIKQSYVALKQLNKSITADFSKLATSIAQASAVYAKLGKAFAELKCENQSAIFNCMGDLHKKLSEGYNTVKDMYASKLGTFFTYYRHEFQSIDELLVMKKEVSENFIASEGKLRKEKELLFEQRNIAKWKLESTTINTELLLKDKALAFPIMIPDKTSEVVTKKMLYGYYLNKVVEEFLRINNKNETFIKSYFQSVSHEFFDQEECIAKLWVELFNNLKEIMKEAQPNHDEGNQESEEGYYQNNY